MPATSRVLDEDEADDLAALARSEDREALVLARHWLAGAVGAILLAYAAARFGPRESNVVGMLLLIGMWVVPPFATYAGMQHSARATGKSAMLSVIAAFLAFIPVLNFFVCAWFLLRAHTMLAAFDQSEARVAASQAAARRRRATARSV